MQQQSPNKDQWSLKASMIQQTPPLANYYQGSLFNLSVNAGVWMAAYMNVLATIFVQNKAQDLTKNIDIKRRLSQPVSRRLMSNFVQAYKLVFQQQLKREFQSQDEKWFMDAASRLMSGIQDRQANNIPGILELDQHQTKNVPSSFYQRFSTLVGNDSAERLSSWLQSQYRWHSMNSRTTQQQQIYKTTFRDFLGQSRLPYRQLFSQTATSMGSARIVGQVKASVRLKQNVSLRYYRQGGNSQQLTHYMYQVIFATFYYSVMPIILYNIFRNHIRFNETIIDNINDIYNNDFKLYFDLQSVSPDPLTITKIQVRAPFRSLFRRVHAQPGRLWQLLFIYYRLLCRSLRDLQANMMQTWQKWQNYGVPDEQGRIHLRIRNVLCTSNVLPITSVLQPLGRGSKWTQLFDLVLDTFLIVKPLVNPVQKLDWTFYSRNRKADLAQFLQNRGNCVRELNQQLALRGYPQFRSEGNHLIDISAYCKINFISLKILGFPQLNVGLGDFVIAVSPNHVAIQPKKRKRIPTNKNVASFLTRQYLSTKRTVVVDRYVLTRPSLENWTLGLQLPLDPTINARAQVSLRRNCLVVDIECLSIEQARQPPYMVCLVGYTGSNSQILYRCWSNTQLSRWTAQGQQVYPIQADISRQSCIYYFVDWLAQIVHLYTKEQPLYIWGYNSLSYELSYMLQHITKRFGVVQLTGHPSQCKSFSIGEGRIIFADILKILPIQKLSDACRQFQVVIRKGELNIASYDNWGVVSRDYELIKEYCYYDCVSTLLLVHKTQVSFIQIAQTLEMPYTDSMISSKLTASALGWMFFIQGFLKVGISNERTSQSQIINLQPHSVYLKQRASYTGGVVQVWRYIYEGKIFVVDINSMYPYMLTRPQPWFYISQTTQPTLQLLQQTQSDFYLFQLISYQLPATFKGAFVTTKQLSQNKNTYFNSYYGQQPFCLRGVTVRRIIHHGGKVCLSRAWRYQSRGNEALADYANFFYKQRKQAKIKSIDQCSKLMMNSVIGRFSMNQKTKYQTTLSPDNDQYEFYSQDFFLQTGQTTQPAVGKFVRITGYITQAAKVYLDQLAEKAGYQNVLYGDTDSLMVTQQGYINLGSPGKSATKLGEFKLQFNEKKNMNNFYTAGYFKNRKDYILAYQSKQGEKQYLYKAKGIPKKYVTREFTQHMINDFKRLQPQLVRAQFGQKFPVGRKVDMKVFRKNFKLSGTTIKQMLKSSSVIVDRFFPQQDSVGIPRSDKYIQIQ